MSGGCGDTPPPARHGATLALWVVALAGTAAAVAWALARSPWGVVAYLDTVRAMRLGHALCLVALTALFFALDYARLAALLALFDHRLGARVAVELTCVSYFISSITPQSELHLPVMVFLLARAGVDVGQATAVTVTKSVYMTLWVCLVALAALASRPDLRLPPELDGHLPALLSPVAALVTALALVVLFASPLHERAKRALARPDRPRWFVVAVRALDGMASSLARLAASRRRGHAFCHAASLAEIAVHALIGLVACRGLGVEVDAGRVLTAFTSGFMVAYVAPVPGSIGVTELATAYLVDPTMPPSVRAAVLTARILCWYGVMIPGALLLVRALRGARLRDVFATR